MRSLQFMSLVHTKAQMALKAEASKLYLSYLWWVIEPILYVAAFYFVFDVLLGFGRGDYLLFLFCGKVPFLWFSKSVNNGASSIVGSMGLINQANIPKHLFVYVAVQGVLYKQWLVFLVLFGAAAIYGYTPSLNWVWLIPLLVVQYMLILLCTMLAAFVVSYISDMRILISMGMMFLMFCSGIFWDLGRVSDPVKRELLLVFNPLAYLIDGYRKVLMYDDLYDIVHLMILGGVVFCALCVMHLVYRYKSQDIASRIIMS